MKGFFLIVFSSGLVWCLTSCNQKQKSAEGPPQVDEKKIEFLIDRNVAAFRIAYNLVDRELRFPPRWNPVRDSLDLYFSDHRNHKIIKILSENDIGYDDVLTEYLLHQKEFPEFGSKHDDSKIINEMELDGYEGIDTLYSAIYEELYNFYQDAKVNSFLTDMDFYYSGAIQEIKKVAERYDIIQQMEDYCRMEHYRYIVSPEPLFLTGGSRGIGPSVITETGKICYQFISPSPNIDIADAGYSESSLEYGYADQDYIRTILVHEFGHSFVYLDMKIDANKRFIDDNSHLFNEDVKRTLMNTGIGDFHTYVIEHIVRLLEIRIAEKFISNEESRKLREENKAFIWLPQMEELVISKYESDAGSGRNFSDFIPELLTVIK